MLRGDEKENILDDERGERLRRKPSDPHQVKNVGGMFHLFFQRKPSNSMRDVEMNNPAAEKAFYLHALNRDVPVPGTQRAFLSSAHESEEIDRLIEVFQTSLDDVQAEGLFEHRG